MIFRIFIVLLPFVVANRGRSDYVKVKRDINRIGRRLTTIEDNIAEERIQRREDVQSVLNKLSELQNTMRENQKEGNKNGEDAESRAKTVIGQITHAFGQEKQMNLKFRKEIQDELKELSSDIVNRLDSFERHLENVSTDLSTIRNDITGETRQVSAETSKQITDNFSEIKQMMASTEGTCQNADDKLEIFRRLGVTTLTTNLNTPADTACLANLVDKTKSEFSSCLDLKYAGYSKDGVYKIKVKDRDLQVYCDQTTDGGGWIVFQRRKDGSVDFYRTWNSYKHGFGDLQSEFWLGNYNLADLTESCCHELRVDLGDVDGSTAYAKYNEFRVLDEGSLYELNIGSYSGDAGDSLKHHDKLKFSTRDSDNDEYEKNCADIWNGAWWFKRCYFSHLNGVYRVDGFVEGNYDRISWDGWKRERDEGGYHSLTFSEMKFR